jgi:hypothetical protein
VVGILVGITDYFNFFLADELAGTPFLNKFGGNSFIPQKGGLDASKRGPMPSF